MLAAPMNNAAQDARGAPTNASGPDALGEAQLVMSIDGYVQRLLPDTPKVRSDVQAFAVAQGLTPEMISAMDIQISPPPRTGGHALVSVTCAS